MDNKVAQALADMIHCVVTQAVLKEITVEQAVSELTKAGVPYAARWVALGFAALDSTYFGTEYAL